MDPQDVIYLSLLAFSIIFGHFYKQIPNNSTKKYVGTLIGIIIILIVSGIHVLHVLILFLSNAFIILQLPKSKCHLISFGFSFLYLLFFRTTQYFGIPYPPSHTNLVQMMMTLKLVSLAFDVNQSYSDQKLLESGEISTEQKEEINYRATNVNFMDILHYSFNYIGVLTGPFIKYQTFKDYFEQPFCHHANAHKATFDKFKYIPFCAVGFLVATYFWPFSYAKSDEFYTERSLLYRMWFLWPTFFIFRMRMYIGLILSECVCTMAAFGAYPEICEPKSGQGPSKNYQQLRNLKNLQQQNYNFNAIHNVDFYQSEFTPTFRDTMKQWNKCIQYWLAAYIYKRFPSKKYRTFVTMAVSAYWHGVYVGHYFTLAGAPFVLPIDGVWAKLLLRDRSGWVLYLNEWLMVVIKMFFFSYLGFAFNLLTFEWVAKYYNSVYHAGLLVGLAMYFLGLQLLKLRAKPQKQD